MITDGSVSLMYETSAALGNGFRMGFLGLLHLDVFRQRLESEYDMDVIVTSPSVAFHVVLKASAKLTAD